MTPALLASSPETIAAAEATIITHLDSMPLLDWNEYGGYLTELLVVEDVLANR